ncbi:hypothetical protein H9Q73_003867 [Fusarium xylarioides]|nr:hypothetical protein H9Q73_003867 [Fusarium xylarioides]
MKVGSVEAVVLLRYRKKEQRRRLPMKPTCNRFVSLTGHKQTNEQRTSALFPLEHPSIALSLTRQSLFPLFDTRSSIRCFKTLSAL